MRSVYLYRVVTLLAIAGVSVLGWSVANAQQSTTDQPREGAMDRMQRGAGDVKEGTERAIDRLRGDQMGGQQGMANAPQLPQGIQQDNLNSGEALHDVLKTLTKSAVSKDSFNDVIDQFATSDRDRLKQAGNLDQAQQQLNATIDRFKQQWQAKYNQDFDIKNEDQLFGRQYMSISEGRVTNPSALSTWPISPEGGASSPMAQQQGRPSLSQDTQVALASFTPGAGKPDLTLSFIHEKPDFWKIDLPDTVNAQQLASNLNSHLNEVISMSSQWPADAQDAQRVVAYHVLQACYGVGSTGGGSQPGMSGQSGSSSQPGSTSPQSQQGQSSGQRQY